MTQEQYQRVIEINKRIEQLNQVKEEKLKIKTKSFLDLMLTRKSNKHSKDSDSLCRDWLMALYQQYPRQRQ